MAPEHFRPRTVDDVVSAVTALPHIVPVGGRTKPALVPMPDAAELTGAARLDLTGLTGILEYEPDEYTFTALAGTTLRAIRDVLAGHGQYLPFDPPLLDAGATLGGTVAAGLSGSGRRRYGGVRDFLIGVRFVDGTGRVVRGGGKVVKNAAGFDLPKLMVGSLGQLGVLTEVSFKVFPEPPAYTTLVAPLPDLETALQAMTELVALPLDLEALDLSVTPAHIELRARLGGLPAALPARMDRARRAVGRGDILTGDAERTLWHDTREFTWAGTRTLVKIPLSPATVRTLDAVLAEVNAARLYSAGANVAWCALDDGLDTLAARLEAHAMAGLVVRRGDNAGPHSGPQRGPLIGVYPGRALFSRIKRTLDPLGRFPDVISRPVVTA